MCCRLASRGKTHSLHFAQNTRTHPLNVCITSNSTPSFIDVPTLGGSSYAQVFHAQRKKSQVTRAIFQLATLRVRYETSPPTIARKETPCWAGSRHPISTDARTMPIVTGNIRKTICRLMQRKKTSSNPSEIRIGNISILRFSTNTKQAHRGTTAPIQARYGTTEPLALSYTANERKSHG